MTARWGRSRKPVGSAGVHRRVRHVRFVSRLRRAQRAAPLRAELAARLRAAPASRRRFLPGRRGGTKCGGCSWCCGCCHPGGGGLRRGNFFWRSACGGARVGYGSAGIGGGILRPSWPDGLRMTARDGAIEEARGECAGSPPRSTCPVCFALEAGAASSAPTSGACGAPTSSAGVPPAVSSR